METSKAIKILKNSILHYAIIDRLLYIGIDSDKYIGDFQMLYELIFDKENKDHDPTDIFYRHCEKLSKQNSYGDVKFTDEALTNTAIEIYSDWKALSNITIV